MRQGPRCFAVLILAWASATLPTHAGEANLLANGGFEITAPLTPKRLDSLRKAGMTFEGQDPLLPLRWSWTASGPVDLRLSPDARTGKHALRVACAKGSTAVEMGVVEVVPGATYSFGAWTRGAGHGRLTIFGNAYEGRKDLARVDLALGNAWAEARQSVAVPGNIRTVTVSMSFWSSAEALVDDVTFSALSDRFFDANAALTEKPKKDGHALVLVDFDGQGEYRLENGATLTDAAGGRFGRGVRLEKKAASTATIPLTLPRMPAEGTLEFWVSPDDEPAHIHWFMALLAGDQDVLKLQADTSDSLSLLWRLTGGIYDRQHAIRGSSMLTRGWFRKGQWHHVAIQWDREAVRFFFDGALLAYDTGRPLPFFATPSAIKVGPLFSVYAWSGAVDEIRLSDIQRYGPFIPTGAAWTPLLAAAADPPRPAEPPKARPAPDFAKERKALLAPLPPPPAGAVSFDASLMKPLVQDDESFAIVKDKPVPGLTLARVGNTRSLIRDPDNDGGYWAVGNIPPGRYFLGVWYESSRRGLEAPQDHYGALVVHLNGRIVQLATTSDPVQAAPGAYFAEAQSKEAVALKPGDEIAVLPARHTSFGVARLTPYPNEPIRGRGWAHENYGATWFCRDTALRLNLDGEFLPAPGKHVREVHFRQVQGADLPDDLRREPIAGNGRPDGSKAVARCRIANPLSVPLTVEYRAEVKAYFRETVGTDQATLTLKPHERVTREIPFAIVPDSRRYTIEAKAKAVEPPSLGWPEADTASFFPGVRQSVPWPEPFVARDERAIVFSGVLPGERTEFSLDGQWESAFTTSLAPPVPPPAGLEWKARRVPFAGYECSLEGMNPRPRGMYLRRKFDAPAAGQKTWRIVIQRVADEATVYVNGKKVGNVRGEETPLTCDVTQAIRPGANEILLVVRDVLAIMDPAYVNPAAPVASAQYLDAPGGVSNFTVGQVTVESAPALAAGDVLVMTSVRKKEIAARFAVTSHEEGKQSVKVVARVLDAGVPVLELGTRDLALEPGGTTQVELTRPWPNPILWGPSSPKLYTLAVEITDAGGRRLDLLRVRFGFRETWIERGRICFNGVPVRLKGSTCQGGGGVLGADDVQWSRGTPIPDFMDEFGYLVSFPLAGIYNSSSRHNVERDAFWDSARANVLAGAARYANHPCILAWDLSNEWLSFLDYGGGDPMAGSRRFKALADALTTFDPTRWIFFNGDEDLSGLHNTFSTHYMALNPISGFLFHGRSPYYPDAAFFRPLDHDFQPGERIRLNPYREVYWRHGEKVLMDTENLWKVSSLMPPGPSRFADEDDVLSPAVDSGRGPIAWMWKLNVDAHRDLGCSAVCNYTRIWAVARRGHMIQCFIMPDQTHHGFAGQKVERKYSLHNDLFVPAAFEFRWALLGPDGKAAAEGQDKHAMESGDLQRGKLAFTLPDVKQRTAFRLKLDLLANGKFAYGEERDIEVWPNTPVPIGALARKLVLFDPAGTTTDVLKKAVIPFDPIARMTAPAGKPEESVLVIGEGAVQDGTPGESDPLRDYAAAGGRVLVLAQEKLIPGLPVRTTLEAREWSSMPFVRTPQHPVMRGATSWDLHFWSPDHVSARGAYSKPDGGPFVTLADSGTDKGLEWVQLMECYRGKGSYLLCQLPLAAKYDSEPMARELLARVVAYLAGGQPFRCPDRPLQVVAGADSLTVSRLRDLGVTCQVVQKEAPLNAGAMLLVDAAALPAPADWRTALDAGATLIVHGASPEQAPILSALAGRPVRLTIQPYAMWEGRGYRNGFTSLTPGLSHVDLYWKDYEGTEGAVAQAEEPKHKIEDLCHWSAYADGAVEHIFPGALVEIPVGKGRLILDQVRWETQNPKLYRLAARVVSAMMMGLNVAVEPYTPPRSLPKGIAYRPLDLTAFANRGFTDAVGDDGKGGWSDQGPKIDLHEFPTGRQPFGGVPFQVGAEPHSCIVLKSNARPFPELQPAEVTIPLGFPVEGLCFLHGSTYTGSGAAAGLYQIQYADGTAHDIALVAEENIRDWVSAPGEFPRERGTKSRVAWTGTTKVFPIVAVYQMLWVNPKPEAPVRAVRFANPARACCPILIALTAAVKGDAASAAPVAAAQATARELLRKGMEAFQAGKDADARGLFQQAVKADPSLDAAHQALGQACDRMREPDAALAAYRAWAEAGARTPLPYNRIGEILELRKDYKGALDAYSKSLSIEWNQPPVIQAKSRLMMLLRQ